MRSARIPALALAAAALLAGTPAAAGHRVVVPADGAVVTAPGLLFIGAGTPDALEVTLNGVRVPVSRVGAAFTGRLDLRPGKNAIVAQAGAGDATTLSVTLDPKATGDVYRLHDPLLDGDCKECHPQGVGRTAAVEASLCRSCHDPKEGAKYLHGPIGAGQCTVCHDPHGSSRPAFLREAVRDLCRTCHDQHRTKEHMERAGARSCTECHDPHGSGKQYLLY